MMMVKNQGRLQHHEKRRMPVSSDPCPRMEISWTDHMKNEKVLHRIKDKMNILHEISKRKGNWIGHILRINCLLQKVTEGKIKEEIEVTGKRGRRCRKLLDDLKERRGYSHLKEEALDRNTRGDPKITGI
jgi:hypothetical protein